MTTLYNPVLNGFHPDPSVVRVGDEWFLATSTFEYLPGIPIHRSRDFENWELIGHVAASPETFGIADVPTAGGVWAPTIRHRDGVFHLVITVAMGRGMLHFTATDAAGPWSDGDVILSADGSDSVNGIDPDIAWDDDGNVYVTYSGLILSGPDIGTHLGILQVKVDLENHIALEEPRSLWSGTGGQFPEAPHLYEVDGTWYLMIAEGGTERGHGISIARGSSAGGPVRDGAAEPARLGALDDPARAEHRPRRPRHRPRRRVVLHHARRSSAQHDPRVLGARPRDLRHAGALAGQRLAGDRPGAAEPAPGHARRGRLLTRRSDSTASGSRSAAHRPTSPTSTSGPAGSRCMATASTSTTRDPVFLGRRQEHLTNSVTVRMDASAGVGGLACATTSASTSRSRPGGGVISAVPSSAACVRSGPAPTRAVCVDLHIDSREARKA